MHRFSNDREALDFVASRIADEAKREGLPLSDVERKMLYFSETAWTLPDISDVSDTFDRDCDQDTYEEKISRLISKAVRRARKDETGDYGGWNEAIRRLSAGDRYLLVMVERANLGSVFKVAEPITGLSLWRPLIAAGTLFVTLVWLLGKRFPDANIPYAYGISGKYGFAIWLAMVVMAALYWLFMVLGRIFPAKPPACWDGF